MSKGDVATEVIRFRISKTTAYKLQKMADDNKRSRSGYIRFLLEQHVETPAPNPITKDSQ